MAILSGFEVRIKSNGQYLTEYNDPASNAQDDGDEIDKYIEAVPGAQFSIEIAVTKKFGYAGADAVHAGYKIDGLKRRWYLFSNRRLGITPSHSLRDEAFIRKETGRCERAKFAFGQLSTGLFVRPSLKLDSLSADRI